MHISPLTNQLASVEQLETTGSRLDGIPQDIEDSLRYAGATLIQAAGILLRLPQEVIAQAIVTFWKYLVGPEGGSLADLGTADISMASLFLTAKLSPYPRTPRSLITVYAYLSSLPQPLPTSSDAAPKSPETYFLSDGDLARRRMILVHVESRILNVLGFNIHSNLPYTLCITYLQALDVFSHPRASELTRRAISHLNTALLSPQLLYLTHQPSSLATAAIYLAAREIGIKLPDVEWWEVFDVEREELGFLCVGMLSAEGFARREAEKWEGKALPMDAKSLREELKRRSSEDVEEE